MENEKPMNTDEWVDRAMNDLNPAESFQPNASRMLAKVRELNASAAAHRRRLQWSGALVSTMCVIAFVIPATRAAVIRACTAACAVVFPSVAAGNSVRDA